MVKTTVKKPKAVVKKTNTEKFERLFQLFASEYVRFVLDMEIDQPLQVGTSLTMVQIPFTVDGYLVDEDDDYFFLSGDPQAENINHAIRKDYIIHVESLDPSEMIEKEIPQEKNEPTTANKKIKTDPGYN